MMCYCEQKCTADLLAIQSLKKGVPCVYPVLGKSSAGSTVHGSSQADSIQYLQAKKTQNLCRGFQQIIWQRWILQITV